MKELLEFLREKCVKGLDEAKEKCIDLPLRDDLGSIKKVLGEWKISSSTSVEMKDTLYDLISTLTDITISHSQNRPAQIICSPLQIGSRRRTRKRLRVIKTVLEGQLGLGLGTTDSSPHGKEEDGRLGTCSPRRIRKIMTALKRLLPQGTKNNSSNPGAGPELPNEITNDHSSNEKKEECSGPETLPEIEGILGFDGKVDEIELRLNVENRGGHIEIGIVGMCGSGKTTLAQLVYRRDRVVQEFESRIWVNLPHQLASNDTYFEQILREILRQCGQDEGDKGGKQQLLRIIRNSLLGKSYLLVLDGVWDADMDWYFELGRALDWHYKDGDVGNDASKSAVIITTRLEEAAKTMVGISALHHIHPYLTPDICWDIFINQVEQGGEINRDNARLLELKNDVKEQCDGLPLAAVTLAGVISQQIIGQQREQDAAAQAGSSVL